MQAEQTKYLRQKVAGFGVSVFVALVDRVNKVNVVNVGERYKRVMFTTYLHESKRLVNVVNVARGFFASRRTYIAKPYQARHSNLGRYSIVR